MTRLSGCAIVLSLVLSVRARAQQPILEVDLAGVGQTLVQARLTDDGLLELPTAPLQELTGEELGEVAYVTLPALRRVLGPGVEIDYDPRRAMVRIFDPLGRLAATQRLVARRETEDLARPSNVLLNGPYAALTADVSGGSLVEAGWNFGRVAFGAARSTESGVRWNGSVRLLRQAYVTYSDTETRGPRFGLRWTGGPTFVETVYAPEDGDLRARAATSLGPWTLYAQDDGTAAVSHRSIVQVTVGHNPDGFVTRVSYGRHSSPLSVPRVR